MNKDLLKKYYEWDYIIWGQTYKSILMNIESLSRSKKVLEIGSRTGGLAQIFVDLGFSNVTISDKGINKRVYPSNLVSLDNIKFLELDLLDDNLNFESQYDIIIMKSVLGALKSEEKQEKALNRIYRMLTNDGMFIIIENQSSGYLLTSIKKQFTSWGAYWKYRTMNEFLNILKTSGFKFVYFNTYGFLNFLFPERIRNFVGIFDIFFANSFVNKENRYVFFGVLRK